MLFCKETEETDYHLFHNCESITNLREELCLGIKNVAGNKFCPTYSEVQLGMLGNDTVSQNLNFIFLICKHYVFQNVPIPLSLSLNAFLHKLKKINIEQKFVAKINLDAEKFYKKWNLISRLNVFNVFKYIECHESGVFMVVLVSMMLLM